MRRITVNKKVIEGRSLSICSILSPVRKKAVPRPSKKYPNRDFWHGNIPSGNPDPNPPDNFRQIGLTSKSPTLLSNKKQRDFKTTDNATESIHHVLSSFK
jgi:hypothetical protein